VLQSNVRWLHFTDYTSGIAGDYTYKILLLPNVLWLHGFDFFTGFAGDNT
jgi:hypothetical protein